MSVPDPAGAIQTEPGAGAAPLDPAECCSSAERGRQRVCCLTCFPGEPHHGAGPGAGAQLREQHATVEGLVDDVVAAYHNGFNKAIQNYSSILRLFGDAKTQARRFCHDTCAVTRLLRGSWCS